MHRITVITPRGAFAAIELGDPAARPLLFLHGFPDHPPTATSFLGLLAGRGFRVLAPWMRGYSPSPLEGPYDLDTLAADALAVADAWAGPGAPIQLVGHDWGAATTYVACAAAPERIVRAVTLALPHPLTFVARLASPAQAARSWYIAAFQLPGAERFVGPRMIDQLWRTWSPGFTLGRDARTDLHACLARSMPAPLGAYRAITRPLFAAAARMRRGAAPITVPTLQLHGADDGCVLPPPGDDAARFTGAYAREVLPGLGHFLHLEAPAPLASRVARWLDVA